MSSHVRTSQKLSVFVVMMVQHQPIQVKDIKGAARYAIEIGARANLQATDFDFDIDKMRMLKKYKWDPEMIEALDRDDWKALRRTNKFVDDMLSGRNTKRLYARQSANTKLNIDRHGELWSTYQKEIE